MRKFKDILENHETKIEEMSLRRDEMRGMEEMRGKIDKMWTEFMGERLRSGEAYFR